MSDVALHRCLIAGSAARVLTEDDQRTAVLWLDADTVAPVLHIQELLTWLWAVYNHLNDNELAMSPAEAPCLSGRYAQRGRPTLYAARRVADGSAEPITVNGTELPPVYAGMGAFIQTSDAFLRHIGEAQIIPWQREGEVLNVPGITACGPTKNWRGEITWGSEDFTYCEWEWTRGRGVFLAPTAFGHEVSQVMWPLDNATLADPAET